MNIQKLIAALVKKNDKEAYESLLALTDISRDNDSVAGHWEDFAQMLKNEKSYERIRGATLLAVNARWMGEVQVRRFLPQYLALTTDEKPVTARKALEGLHEILRAHPELAPEVREHLADNDYSVYKDSMRTLLEKDTMKFFT